MAAQPDSDGATTDEPSASPSVRRRALFAGVAGAAAGVFVRAGRPAAATSGAGGQDALVLGSNDTFNPLGGANTANSASVATVLKATPNYANYIDRAGAFVFRADASSIAGNPAVNGLEGLACDEGSGVAGTSPTGSGVEGTGRIGVNGVSTSNGPGVQGYSPAGFGMLGISTDNVGGVFAGGTAAIALVASVTAGPPTTGLHIRGSMMVDADGILFLCKDSGNPGTWVQVSEQRQPSLRTLPTPERFIDTRSKLGGVQGPVAAGTTSTFEMTSRNGESGNAMLQIPDSATILVGNLSVIGGPSVPVGSFVTLWPSGPRPATSSISFGPGAIVANSFTVGLGPTTSGHGSINVFAQQQCDYIVDVVAYYS